MQLRKQCDEHLQKTQHEGDEHDQQETAHTAVSAVEVTMETEQICQVDAQQQQETAQTPHAALIAPLKAQKHSQLAQGLMSSDPDTQLDATREFRKLSSREPSPIQEIIDAGVVPRLVEFLQEFSRAELQVEGKRTPFRNCCCKCITSKDSFFRITVLAARKKPRLNIRVQLRGS